MTSYMNTEEHVATVDVPCGVCIQTHLERTKIDAIVKNLNAQRKPPEIQHRHQKQHIQQTTSNMAENDTADKPDAAGATDEKADISGIDAEFCQKKLRQFTEQKQKIKLKDFFTDEKLKALSPTALAMFKSLIDDGCSVERALKFMALTMYYIVVLIGKQIFFIKYI